MIGFYDDDDIALAKQTLFKFAESLADKPDGLPRLIRRTANDNKRNVMIMLSLYCCLDDGKVHLPTYAAVNLNRVPTVSAGMLTFLLSVLTYRICQRKSKAWRRH